MCAGIGILIVSFLFLLSSSFVDDGEGEEMEIERGIATSTSSSPTVLSRTVFVVAQVSRCLITCWVDFSRVWSALVWEAGARTVAAWRITRVEAVPVRRVKGDDVVVAVVMEGA